MISTKSSPNYLHPIFFRLCRCSNPWRQLCLPSCSFLRIKWFFVFVHNDHCIGEFSSIWNSITFVFLQFWVWTLNLSKFREKKNIHFTCSWISIWLSRSTISMFIFSSLILWCTWAGEVICHVEHIWLFIYILYTVTHLFFIFTKPNILILSWPLCCHILLSFS